MRQTLATLVIVLSFPLLTSSADATPFGGWRHRLNTARAALKANKKVVRATQIVTRGALIAGGSAVALWGFFEQAPHGTAAVGYGTSLVTAGFLARPDSFGTDVALNIGVAGVVNGVLGSLAGDIAGDTGGTAPVFTKAVSAAVNAAITGVAHRGK